MGWAASGSEINCRSRWHSSWCVWEVPMRCAVHRDDDNLWKGGLSERAMRRVLFWAGKRLFSRGAFAFSKLWIDGCCCCDSIAIHAPIMSQSATSESYVKGILQKVSLSVYGNAEFLLARIPHNRRFIACQFPPFSQSTRAAAIHRTRCYFNFIHQWELPRCRVKDFAWFVDYLAMLE